MPKGGKGALFPVQVVLLAVRWRNEIAQLGTNSGNGDI
jgi:hypothetical protein